jgi:hypothetical protein
MSKSRASNGERKTEEQKRKKSFQILNSHVGTRCDQYFLQLQKDNILTFNFILSNAAHGILTIVFELKLTFLRKTKMFISFYKHLKNILMEIEICLSSETYILKNGCFD